MARIKTEEIKVRTKKDIMEIGRDPLIRKNAEIDYTDEIGQAICLKIAEGNSIVKICEMRLPGCPTDRTTIYKWLLDPDEKYDHFREMHQMAREVQGFYYGETALDEVKKMLESKDKDAAGRARILFDAIRWHAGKMAPKLMGDDRKLRITGADGESDPVMHFYIPDNHRTTNLLESDLIEENIIDVDSSEKEN